MRDRLIALLNKLFEEQYEKRELLTAQYAADHLLEDGIIVPPVNIGQTVWVYNATTNNIYKNKVVCINIMGASKYKNRIVVEYRNQYGESSCRKFTWAQIGKQVFLTEQEAVEALAERSGK